MTIVRFAPLSVPLERRLETLAVLYFVLQIFILSFLAIIVSVLLLFTCCYPLILLYAAWLYYDRKTPLRGGRRSQWARRWRIWKYMADYFPIKLIKTGDLPADKNYIFGCHPHGIICFSHFVNFATEATNFSKTFPGIKPHLITLNLQFYAPIHRELLLAHGTCSAAKENIEYIISKKGVGNAVALIVGGAREAVYTVQGKMILYLKNRKGFIRIALKHGASLVPVIAFGENDVYNTFEKEVPSFFEKLQSLVLRLLTISLPFFMGRGVFQYTIGLLPFRRPINTIVGKPIHVEKNPNPTQEEIDNLHRRYIEELTKLFEENKEKHYPSGETTLEII